MATKTGYYTDGYYVNNIRVGIPPTTPSGDYLTKPVDNNTLVYRYALNGTATLFTGVATAFAKSSSVNLAYYVNGMPGTDVVNNVYYLNGARGTGVFNTGSFAEYFVNGTRGTGTVSGVYYVNGPAANGVYNNIYYVDGVRGTGTANGIFYVTGTPRTGLTDGVYYVNGLRGTGVFGGIYYVNGVVSTGVFNGVYYVNGLRGSGCPSNPNSFSAGPSAVLYKNGTPYTGEIINREETELLPSTLANRSTVVSSITSNWIGYWPNGDATITSIPKTYGVVTDTPSIIPIGTAPLPLFLQNDGNLILGLATASSLSTINVSGAKSIQASLNAIDASRPIYIVDKNGRLTAQGTNGRGIQSISTTIPSNALSGIKDVRFTSGSTTSYVFLALKDNGTTFSWFVTGITNNSNIPQNITSLNISLPEQALSGVNSIAADNGLWTGVFGTGFCFTAVKNDNTAIAWRTNIDFRSDTPGITCANISMPVEVSTNITKVVMGNKVVALKTNGSVVSWSLSSYTAVDVQTEAVSGVVDITTAANYCLALKSDGSVIGWGDNTYGQINIPATALSGVVSIGTGGTPSVPISYAIKSDGTVIIWGRTGFIAAGPAISAVNIVNRSGSMASKPIGSSLYLQPYWDLAGVPKSTNLMLSGGLLANGILNNRRYNNGVVLTGDVAQEGKLFRNGVALGATLPVGLYGGGTIKGVQWGGQIIDISSMLIPSNEVPDTGVKSFSNGVLNQGLVGNTFFVNGTRVEALSTTTLGVSGLRTQPLYFYKGSIANGVINGITFVNGVIKT